MTEEVKIDHYDVDNLCLFEEQLCPQDINSDEDNHATHEHSSNHHWKEEKGEIYLKYLRVQQARSHQ